MNVDIENKNSHNHTLYCQMHSCEVKRYDMRWLSYVNFKQIKYSNTCQKSKIKIQ